MSSTSYGTVSRTINTEDARTAGRKSMDEVLPPRDDFPFSRAAPVGDLDTPPAPGAVPAFWGRSPTPLDMPQTAPRWLLRARQRPRILRFTPLAFRGPLRASWRTR